MRYCLMMIILPLKKCCTKKKIIINQCGWSYSGFALQFSLGFWVLTNDILILFFAEQLNKNCLDPSLVFIYGDEILSSFQSRGGLEDGGSARVGIRTACCWNWFHLVVPHHLQDQLLIVPCLRSFVSSNETRTHELSATFILKAKYFCCCIKILWQSLSPTGVESAWCVHGHI